MKFVIGPMEEPKIEVGSCVEPWDGSYSLTLKEGIMVHESVAYPPCKEKWRVIVLDGEFPIDRSILKHIPYANIPESNNVMMVSVRNPNKYCFIRLEYLTKL